MEVTLLNLADAFLVNRIPMEDADGDGYGDNFQADIQPDDCQL